MQDVRAKPCMNNPPYQFLPLPSLLLPYPTATPLKLHDYEVGTLRLMSSGIRRHIIWYKSFGEIFYFPHHGGSLIHLEGRMYL